MKLGIISDTHGLVARTKAAIDLFRDQEVDRILHCGDIGTAEIIRLFREIPTDFVFGNSDPRTETLRREILAIGLHCQDWFGTLESEGKRICFLHGHQNGRLEQEIASGQWDLICFGHTHVPDLQLFGKTLLLNPGAVQRTPTPSVAIVELPEMTVRTWPIG